MAQAGGGQVQAGFAVGERPHDPRSSPDLAHDAFQRVVGSELDPMAVGKGVVGQGLMPAFFEQTGGLAQHLPFFSSVPSSP